MQNSFILWPVFVQIMLTLVVFLIMGKRKSAAIKAGGVDRRKAALDNSAWPETVVKTSNNIQNQFQTPVLFYVLCLSFISINAVNIAAVALAWAYVLSRLIHAYVHIGSNYVPLRFRMFLFGTLILIIMTILLGIRLLQS